MCRNFLTVHVCGHKIRTFTRYCAFSTKLVPSPRFPRRIGSLPCGIYLHTQDREIVTSLICCSEECCRRHEESEYLRCIQMWNILERHEGFGEIRLEAMKAPRDVWLMYAAQRPWHANCLAVWRADECPSLISDDGRSESICNETGGCTLGQVRLQ